MNITLFDTARKMSFSDHLDNIRIVPEDMDPTPIYVKAQKQTPKIQFETNFLASPKQGNDIPLRRSQRTTHKRILRNWYSRYFPPSSGDSDNEDNDGNKPNQNQQTYEALKQVVDTTPQPPTMAPPQTPMVSRIAKRKLLPHEEQPSNGILRT